jgi:hypothetical protein
MEKFDNGPYRLNIPRSQRGRIRSALAWSALCAVLPFGGFYFLVMQPYAVMHRGECLYEIQPTGLNGEEVLPCGSLPTRFAISEEVYLAER